jgi:hypothetical protein
MKVIYMECTLGYMQSLGMQDEIDELLAHSELYKVKDINYIKLTQTEETL